MIKFFRHIRKSHLMETGKTIKYLKYAIGEIVLVVLGILIALQINNSNENRIKRKFEITILENIKEDIVADKSDCELNLQYLKVEFTNEQRLLDFLLADSVHPSDGISFVDALGMDLAGIYHNASFNNLQNNDIGLITNNRLYKDITRYYDFYVSSLQTLENEHDYPHTYDEKFPFFKKHFIATDKKLKVEINSGKDTWEQDFDRYKFEIKNVEVLKNDEEFKVLLAESLFINSIKVSFYQQLLKKMETLSESIDNELLTLKK